MSSSLSEYELKELFRCRKFNPGLKSTSGKQVEIIQTGEPNLNTGPDFKASLVKMNGVVFRGDIELHRRSSDWFTHNHHYDRNYNSVILHVVVESDDLRECVTESRRHVETVELSPFLSADAAKFLKGLDNGEAGSLPCAAVSYRMRVDEKKSLLDVLGEKRFFHKVGRFEERLKDIIDENRPVVFEAKQKYFKDFSELLIEHKTYEESELKDESYWDQLLYEGISEGLGYSKNTAAFRKLARNASLSFIKEHANGDRLSAEAILFGAAGLLPQSVSDFDEESVSYCASLDQIWQGLRKKYRREHLDKSEWLFFKLRPQNFPTMRLAGAAYLLTAKEDGFSARRIVGREHPTGVDDLLSLWRDTFTVPSADYWSRHFLFGAVSNAKVKMLIGLGRVEEIIINVLLPIMHLRGTVFNSEPIRQTAMSAYKCHPPIADNNITVLVKEGLFGGDNVFDSVVTQQGALHIYRTLCSERRCQRCKIGKVVFRKPAA